MFLWDFEYLTIKITEAFHVGISHDDLIAEIFVIL